VVLNLQPKIRVLLRGIHSIFVFFSIYCGLFQSDNHLNPVCGSHFLGFCVYQCFNLFALTFAQFLSKSLVSLTSKQASRNSGLHRDPFVGQMIFG